MAWRAQQGVPLTFPHPVRDADGNFVAGQAASVTQSLLGPDRAAGSEVATLIDNAVDGWVDVSITLTEALGVYTLELTNPSAPTADGRVTEYSITVSAGFAAADNLLTTRDRVRTRLQLKKEQSDPSVPITPGDSHVLDALIDLLISEVSDEYQNWVGRTFGEATYTEYLDGSGRSSLILGVGPLVSVTSLESVEYEDDGAGGVTETKTLIAPHTYVVAGLRTQPRYTGRGRIDSLGRSVFTRGPRRYRVIFVAGFDPIPEAVIGLATTDVVSRLNTRETGHLLSKSLGDGTTAFLRPGQMQEAREVGLTPYLVEAA